MINHPVAEDLAWMFGYIEDVTYLGRNRRTAQEVRLLSELVRNRRANVRMPHRTSTLAQSLGGAKGTLRSILESAQVPSVLHVEWAAKPANEDVPESEAKALPAPQQEPKPLEPAAGNMVTIANAAIDLCDWLDRAQQDERIGSPRAIQTAAEKGMAILDGLGIVRIDRKGKFDQRDQQIVDCVAASTAEEDMQVCQTVQCGYRTGDRIIRPQRVMVYRFSANVNAL